MGSPRRWSVLLALVVCGSVGAAGAEPTGQHGAWQEAKPTTDTIQNRVSGVAWVGSDEKGESQFLLVHDAKWKQKDFVRLMDAMRGALYVLGSVRVGADGTPALALKEPFVARGLHCHKVEGLVPMPKSGGAFLFAADDDEGGGFLRVP